MNKTNYNPGLDGEEAAKAENANHRGAGLYPALCDHCGKPLRTKDVILYPNPDSTARAGDDRICANCYRIAEAARKNKDVAS